MVGGHEGAGVIEAVGPGVTRVKVGDHVVCSFIPACGICRYCSTGRQNLCDWGAQMMTGMLADGTFRFHDDDGADLGGFCMLGTFAERAVISQNSCVPIERDIPFEVAALTGCGVPTGWGTAVYAAGVRAGQTVVVFGAGGVGTNAVQGARYAGAAQVIVIDPVEFKRENALAFGATHVFATAGLAQEAVIELTRGQLADHALITIGVLSAEVVEQADRDRRQGRPGDDHVGRQVGGEADPARRQRQRGRLAAQHPGPCLRHVQPAQRHSPPAAPLPAGQLKLEELITRALLPRRGQPGLPGPGRRQADPRRHHPRASRRRADGLPAPRRAELTVPAEPSSRARYRPVRGAPGRRRAGQAWETLMAAGGVDVLGERGVLRHGPAVAAARCGGAGASTPGAGPSLRVGPALPRGEVRAVAGPRCSARRAAPARGPRWQRAGVAAARAPRPPTGPDDLLGARRPPGRNQVRGTGGDTLGGATWLALPMTATLAAARRAVRASRRPREAAGSRLQPVAAAGHVATASTGWPRRPGPRPHTARVPARAGGARASAVWPVEQARARVSRPGRRGRQHLRLRRAAGPGRSTRRSSGRTSGATRTWSPNSA